MIAIETDKNEITADGVDVATLTPIPAGTTIMVWFSHRDSSNVREKVGEVVVNDGILEITVDTPGRYAVEAEIPFVNDEGDNALYRARVRINAT